MKAKFKKISTFPAPCWQGEEQVKINSIPKETTSLIYTLGEFYSSVGEEEVLDRI